MNPVRAAALGAAIISIACADTSAPVDGDQGTWLDVGDASVRVEYQTPDPALSLAMLDHARAGRDLATTFFGEVFKSGFTVRVYPDRSSLTTYWRAAWAQPSLVPECWMVASAVRTMAVVLSPRTWAASACGHNASDASYVRRLVSHEIVHVLHAQLNALPEVNAVGALKWFNEGVAYYAAGQLDDASRAQVRALIASGYQPTTLEAVLPGQGGYPAAASIVAYIDRTFGRDALRRLLRATSTAEALAMLSISEQKLLADWRAAQQ
jgi:hypothetical protein